MLSLAEARALAREQLEAARGAGPAPRRAPRSSPSKAAVTVGAPSRLHRQARQAAQRRAKDTARELRTYLGAKWADRPLEEITRDDVVNLVEAIAARRRPAAGDNVLGQLRRSLPGPSNTAG